MNPFLDSIKRGFGQGLGWVLALGATALVAATVSGTISTFSSGEILDAAKINTNFSSLKTAIESIDPQYSTAETETHLRWTDGKTIYRRVYNITLPNGTSNTAHGLPAGFRIIRLYGAVTNGTNTLSLPYTDAHINGGTPDNCEVLIDATNIVLTTQVSLTSYSGHLILEYTK